MFHAGAIEGKGPWSYGRPGVPLIVFTPDDSQRETSRISGSQACRTTTRSNLCKVYSKALEFAMMGAELPLLPSHTTGNQPNGNLWPN